MPTAPLRTQEIPELIRPRPPLKQASVKLAFESHPQSTIPGVRVFPKPIGGTLLDRKTIA